MGPFLLLRDWKEWIIAVNGDEFKFRYQKDALFFAKTLIENSSLDIRIIEEKTMRFKRGDMYDHDEKYRTDVTERLKYKILREYNLNIE